MRSLATKRGILPACEPHGGATAGSKWMGVDVVPVSSPSEIGAARQLFEEYAASLELDLGFQGFATELVSLPGDYAPPRGALLLAVEGEAVVGCVGLRPFEWPRIGELKRLYVRPQGRGRGLGLRLSLEALREARDAGYQRVRLDTLPSMVSAQRLYESLGFYEIDAYCFNPVSGTRYMELDLGVGPRAPPGPAASRPNR